MPKTPEDPREAICAHCHRPQGEHRAVNYADLASVGGAMLVCPTSIFIFAPQRTSQPVQTPEKLDHHYSGNNSQDFWDRIRRLAEYPPFEVYGLGCDLQNLEEHTLRALEKAERERKELKR